MLLYEKYSISHINYNTGIITIEHSGDIEEDFEGLIRGFAKLTEGRKESLGMMQYRVTNAPFDFIFQIDFIEGIVIVAEDMRKIDKIVGYIKESIADINYNLLYYYKSRLAQGS